MHFLYSILAILNEMSPYILLGFFIAGLLHVFVKPSMMARHLSGNGFKPVLKSALLGIPLPLCSCGVLPTAVSLRRAGASNAAATSFLIATPQTGVDSIAATWSLLGPAMAVVRPVAALTCSLLGGVTVGRLAPSEAMTVGSPESCGCGSGDCHGHGSGNEQRTFFSKLVAALKYGFIDMIQHVGKWLVIGLIVAALITVFVPDDFFVGLARYPLLAMLAMVAVAVPMYICATGSIPIALSLMLKGLTPGVAFVMLMAGPAANFASVMVLRKSLGTRATAIYIASVVLTAIGFGLLIDYLLPASWFMPSASMCGACHGAHGFGWFDTGCSILLVALLAYAFYVTKIKKQPEISTEMDKRIYTIKGMMCPHCQANVQKGLESLEGVEAVTVNLDKACAEVAGDVAPDVVIAKIEALGYEAALA